MLTVGGFAVFLRRFEQSALAYPAHVIGYLLRRRDFYSLQALNGLDEVRRVEQCVNGARVEPREASAHKADIEIAVFEIYLVYVGYLKLAARRGLDMLGNFNNTVIIKIKTGDNIVGFRILRLFLQTYHSAAGIKLHHSEGAGILHIAAKNSRTAF